MDENRSIGGIFPPIPTPFGPRGEVDHDALRENVSKWNETDLAGYVVFGSNGENVFLGDDEKIAVLRTVVAAAGRDKKVIAGTGCESTAATVELTRRAADVGAEAALVVNPHYYKLDDEGLQAHYTRIADAATIPVLLYNVPKFTGVNMSSATVLKVAEHPNVVGIKDSSGNVPQLTELILGAPDGFAVMAGTASILYSAVSLGAAGGVVALANVAPKEACLIMQLARDGAHEEARQLQMRMFPVNSAVTARFGVPGLKHALDLLGYKGGPPRSPLRELDSAGKAELQAILRRAELL